MTYVNMGKYNFITGPDYTGLNSENLTSILSLSTLRVPSFEMYRLLLNTSAIPSSAPSVVQTATATGTSGSTLDVTFGAATTAGNTVVVTAGTFGSTTNPTVSGITLGGSADNWARITSTGGADYYGGELWADPATAETSDAIVISLTGGSGTYVTQAFAYELSGMLDTTSAAACFDVSYEYISDVTSATSWTAGTVENNTYANDLFIGTFFAIGTGSYSLSNVTPGFNTLRTLGPAANGGDVLQAMSAWQNVSAAGSNASYTVQASKSVYPGSVAATFVPSAVSPASSAFPFTVAIDGNTWDQQQTTPGVGYTYNMNQPLYLNNGQTLQILWDLPVMTYASYARYFNCTAWFRYDPDAQPS